MVGRVAGMSDQSGPRGFATTRWTLVLAAGDRDSPDADTALASLCEAYWPPVYAYIRRSGRDGDAARDLTQAFFAQVLEKNFFGRAQRERGRFRTFLLSSVKNFLTNEWDRGQAAKRGAGRQPLSLEVDDGERSYQIEIADDVTPEHLYERRWALTVIGAAMARLERRFDEGGKQEMFTRLKPFLTGQGPRSYADLATELAVSEGSLRVAVHRMRHQFAESLRETIAETVESDDEVEEELRYLLGAVAK